MAPDTRDRILATAWDLVAERGAGDVTLAEVAGRAGISRQALYLHVRGRGGLLLEMARDHDRRSGFVDAVQRAATQEPAAGLEELIRAWCAYVPSILPVARHLEAAALRGEEGAEAWRDRMDGLRVTFRAAVQRLADAGLLADGWTVDDAADWTWALCHLSSWRHLVEERGWPPERFADRAVAGARTELLDR